MAAEKPLSVAATPLKLSVSIRTRPTPPAPPPAMAADDEETLAPPSAESRPPTVASTAVM